MAGDTRWRPDGRSADGLTGSAGTTRSRRRGRTAAAVLGLVGLASMSLVPVATAAGGVELATPYAAVSVEPGSTASFDLFLTSDAERRVALEVTAVPDGWTAEVRGGGFIVDGVLIGDGDEPELTLDVDVPEDATDGSYRVTVRANGGGAAVDTLDVDLRVAVAAAGSVSLTTDNPVLRDDADATYPFSLTLENDTPRELTFAFSASTPAAGWVVNARPSSQSQAASIVVAAGATTAVSVTADPPDGVEAGTYDITVTASAGDLTAEASVQVEIVGQVELVFDTLDGRLSTNANAGSQKDVSVRLINNGSAPITGVTLDGNGPTDWEVTFEPETVDVQPGVPAAQTVVAHITPSGSAIAGDYQVTLTASTADGVSETLELRVTVDTSGLWGLIGLGLVAVTLVGLLWVFQRYGRR